MSDPSAGGQSEPAVVRHHGFLAVWTNLDRKRGDAVSGIQWLPIAERLGRQRTHGTGLERTGELIRRKGKGSQRTRRGPFRSSRTVSLRHAQSGPRKETTSEPWCRAARMLSSL